jgi:hypothetical protein
VDWIRQCADWLIHLHTREFPPAVSLRPESDHPDKAHVMVDLPLAAILQRIAADVDELARARRVADLGAAASDPDRPVPSPLPLRHLRAAGRPAEGVTGFRPAGG